MNSMKKVSLFALLMLAMQMSYSHAGLADDVAKLKLEQEYNYLKARKALQECLVEGKYQKKNINGYPAACESLVASFALYGGSEEANQMLKVFTEHSFILNKQ